MVANQVLEVNLLLLVMWLNNMLKILSVILKKKKYAIVALIATVIMATISYYLTVVNIYHKSLFAYADMNGTLFTIVTSFLGLIISLLVGFYFALIIFRRDITKVKTIKDNTSGLAGVGTGIIASGCPSCGVPLLGLIGFPLALYSLPFKGLELKVLSIGFLILGIFLISKNIKKNLVCQCAIDIPITKSVNTI